MLSDNEVSFRILIDLKESHDIRVIHSFENINFLQESGLLFALEKTFLNNFHSPFSTGFPVCAEANLTKGT